MTRLPAASERSSDVPYATSRSPPAAHGGYPAPHEHDHWRHVRPRPVPCGVVLVLLPPSETKHPGGSGAPLDLAALSTPELTPLRERLVDAVVACAADVPTARAALGLSPAQDGEIARNALLRSSPTLPG